jgi:ABC-type multidrug transport system fused ATPase/permease subunit
MSAGRERQGRGFSMREHLTLNWPSLALGFALGAVLLVLSVVQPFWAGNLIAQVQNADPVAPVLLVVIGLSVAVALASGLQQYVLGRLTENSVAGWREVFVKSFLRLPLLGRQRWSAAWFGSRLVTDPPLIGRFVGGVIVQSITSTLLAATSLVVLLTLDAPTVFIPLAFAALSMLASLFGARFVGADRLGVQQENARMSGVMARAVDSARVVIASNADHAVEADLRTSIGLARRHGVRLNVIYSLVGPVTVTLMQLAYASVFVVGGWRVASEAMPFPMFITFIMMFGLFQSAVQDVSAIPLGISECRAALAHLSQIDEISKPHSDVLPRAHGDQRASDVVRFESVGFGYGAEPRQLTDVSFAIPKGSLAALIGPSGGGKSTCLGLIEGFFFAESGSISVLGRDMTPRTAVSLRDSLGYVDQESALVGDTIRSILQFGLPPGASNDDDLLDALNAVGLTEWAESRGGLDGSLDDRATQISGGQRQLLAIARALVRKPELLLLDEPTSNLDGATEARIRQVLRQIANRTSVVMTAHRLSTILEADWIVVLDGGRVVGSGTHEVLISTCSQYVELVSSQTTLADSAFDVDGRTARTTVPDGEIRA